MAHHVLDVTLEPGNYTTPGDVTRIRSRGALLLTPAQPWWSVIAIAV